MTIRIQVQDLEVGDRLVPTMRTVTQRPTAGARTPTGKVDLDLDGRRVTFGKYTVVTVRRGMGA